MEEQGSSSKFSYVDDLGGIGTYPRIIQIINYDGTIVSSIIGLDNYGKLWRLDEDHCWVSYTEEDRHTCYLIIVLRDGTLTKAFLSSSDHTRLTREFGQSVIYATAMFCIGRSYDEARAALVDMVHTDESMGFSLLRKYIIEGEHNDS